MQKKIKNISRIPINGMLIAVYIVLSLPMLTVNIGGLKFTFEHFPVLLSAVLYGPIDALLVGVLGELINQLTTFGLTPTTVLWILPIAVRALLVGISGQLFKKQMHPKTLFKELPIVFFIVCILSGIVSSILNTLALYVDSKMFGYYTYELVFGVLSIRIILSVITSFVMANVITPILYALKKAHLV